MAGRSKIAYAGVPGAFAEIACRRFQSDHDAIGRASFADAVGAVVDGKAEMAAIPTRNSVAGNVPGVADLLKDSGLRIVAEHDLPIAMHCLALPGVTLDDIEEVRSHPVALRQCSHFVATRGWREIEDTNTAVAAMIVHNCNETSCAVLASERTAELYGLEILQRDVQDEGDNSTVFAFLARN